jgi:tRNA threonylcarbamoyladenosine biosynthesis protein TsaB
VQAALADENYYFYLRRLKSATTIFLMNKTTIKILAIDCTTDACSAALLLDDDITELFEIAPKKHTQLILPMIEKLLQQASIKITNLSAIAFGCGPGSFTGVRVAASIAQGLAFGANLPVVPVSSLRALAQRAHRAYHKSKIIVALDARMDEVYLGYYQLNQNGIMEKAQNDALISVKTAFDLTLKDTEWFLAGDVWHTILAAEEHTMLLPRVQLHAKDIAKIAYEEYLAGNAVDAAEALPVYLRS